MKKRLVHCVVITLALFSGGCQQLAAGLRAGLIVPTATPHPTAVAFWAEYEQNIKYRSLNAETIAALPNADLYQASLDIIWLRMKGRGDWEQVLMEMPAGYTDLYFIRWYEAEVNNGGHNQYFFNSSGQYVEETLTAIERVGAQEYQENLEKAIAIRLSEADDPTLRALYDDQTLESFMETYKYSSLDECDDRFYALGDELAETVGSYMKQHPELFAD